MDVGDPSNFVRIQKIYGNDFENLSQHLSGYRFTDEETRDAMKAHSHLNLAMLPILTVQWVI